MRLNTLWRATCVLLCMLGLCTTVAACSPTPTPTPPPTPAAQPTATGTVTGTATATQTVHRDLPAAPTQPTSHQLLTFQLQTPAQWQAVALTGRDQSSLLQEVSLTQHTAATFATTLLATLERDQPLLLAWPASTLVDAKATGLVGYALPRTSLSLARYITDATMTLEEQPAILVNSAIITTTLRPEGTPVGVIHYTLSAGPTSVDGYQVILLDQQGATLLILTFFAPTATFSAWRPTFDTIVEQITSD